MTTHVKRKNRFEEVLSRYKQNEKPESVLLVAQDRHLLRLLTVWDETRVQRRKRLSPLSEDGDDETCWQWLWENAVFSMEELAGLTGFSIDAVEEKMGVLIGNRLIYPDGTMTQLAAQFLRIRVLTLFRAGNSMRRKSEGVAKDAIS